MGAWPLARVADAYNASVKGMLEEQVAGEDDHTAGCRFEK